MVLKDILVRVLNESENLKNNLIQETFSKLNKNVLLVSDNDLSDVNKFLSEMLSWKNNCIVSCASYLQYNNMNLAPYNQVIYSFFNDNIIQNEKSNSIHLLKTKFNEKNYNCNLMLTTIEILLIGLEYYLGSFDEIYKFIRFVVNKINNVSIQNSNRTIFIADTPIINGLNFIKKINYAKNDFDIKFYSYIDILDDKNILTKKDDNIYFFCNNADLDKIWEKLFKDIQNKYIQKIDISNLDNILKNAFGLILAINLYIEILES